MKHTNCPGNKLSINRGSLYVRIPRRPILYIYVKGKNFFSRCCNYDLLFKLHDVPFAIKPKLMIDSRFRENDSFSNILN